MKYINENFIHGNGKCAYFDLDIKQVYKTKNVTYFYRPKCVTLAMAID